MVWVWFPFAGVNRCFSKYDLQVKTTCIVEVVYMHFVNTEDTTGTVELALYYMCCLSLSSRFLMLFQEDSCANKPCSYQRGVDIYLLAK